MDKDTGTTNNEVSGVQEQPAQVEKPEEKPCEENKEEEEELDDDIFDDAQDLLEEKLNLTAGERTKDDALGPEMDKLFEDFMSKIQQDPESKNAFNEMGKMFENVFTQNGDGQEPLGEKFEKMMGGEEGAEENQNFDKMTDMLLSQFMDKELLYEPLCSAKTELRKAIDKHDKGEEMMEEKDKDVAVKQLACVEELVTLFENNSEDKQKMISIFERMNNLGSLFEIIKKYAPESDINQKSGMDELGPLAGLFSGGADGMPGMPPGMPAMPGMPGMPGANPEDCNLI